MSCVVRRWSRENTFIVGALLAGREFLRLKLQRRRRLSRDGAQLQATPEIDLSSYPNVKAYLERMRARPSVAAALATEVPLFRAEMTRRKAA